MKNFWQIITALMAVALVVLLIRLSSVERQDIVIQEVEVPVQSAPSGVIVSIEDSLMVINTTEIAKDIVGFNGPTPLRLYLRDGVIERVEPLDNVEDTYYFDLLLEDNLFDSWTGLNLQDVVEYEVDAVSGATFSSRAVIETVKRAATFK